MKSGSCPSTGIALPAESPSGASFFQTNAPLIAAMITASPPQTIHSVFRDGSFIMCAPQNIKTHHRRKEPLGGHGNHARSWRSEVDRTRQPGLFVAGRGTAGFGLGFQPLLKVIRRHHAENSPHEIMGVTAKLGAV